MNKTGRSAKYIRYFDSCELIYTEIFETRTEALKREWQLKKMTKEKKEKLISSIIKV
jgi:putative endonuclease